MESELLNSNSWKSVHPNYVLVPKVKDELAIEKIPRTKTLIVVILDESGSMESQKNDVVGGYQSFIEEQAEIKEDEARLVLIKFNTTITIQHAAMPLERTPKLTVKNFWPRGGTALYDAVADGIRIGEATVQKDERVLVLIMTDGEDNSSKKANENDIRDLIKKKERLAWTFTYIGQSPEVWARTMQISTNNVCRYNTIDQKANMKRNSTAVAIYRRGTAKKTKNFYHPYSN